jgi:polyhydroxyalkanoate synthesis regulator phasin
MANATLKKEERETLCAQKGCLASQNSSNGEDILNSLQSLEVDKIRLTEQEEHLTALLSQLEIKAKEEVKKRKRKVERLNSEVSDLKQKCEKLTSWINSESTLECSQTGF